MLLNICSYCTLVCQEKLYLLVLHLDVLFLKKKKFLTQAQGTSQVLPPTEASNGSLIYSSPHTLKINALLF